MAYNKVILEGYLTRDVEISYTPSGAAVGKFGLAVNEKYGDKEQVLFVEITVWKKVAENCEEYLSKGSRVLVDGKLKYETWEKDGAKRSRHTVTAFSVGFLDSKSNPPASNEPPLDDSDSIPF